VKEKKKKKIIVIVLAVLALITVISISYAFVTQTLTGGKQVVVNAGVLDLILEEDNAITISDAMPMYDEVGMIQEDVFEFRLVNKTSNSTYYNLKLTKITSDNELDTSNVKYYLTKDGVGEPKLLSSLSTNGVVDKGSIAGNDTIDYTLRLWIDSEVTNNDAIAGKSLSYEINVEVKQYTPYQVRYGELYSVTLEGTQFGVVINEDGSGIIYNNYAIEAEFEAGSFTFTDNNITFFEFNFEISEDGTELYFEAYNEKITLDLIEKGGDILFGKKYSVTVDGRQTVSVILNEDGSYFTIAQGESQTTPAGTMYYEDGSIYDSETDELVAYVMDDGNMIHYQGMLFKYSYSTVKIHNDNYKVDIPISSDSYVSLYSITDKFYTKEDLVGSYLVFQSKNLGAVDAYYLSSDFIDSNIDDDGVMYFDSDAMWLSIFFVPEGHVYEESYFAVGKGTYFFDRLGMFGYDVSPLNIVISKSIDNPILLETQNNSEAESYDMDLTASENILYHVSDEYFEVDELLNATLIEKNADMPVIHITSDKITQISENVYMIDDNSVRARYFCKEDTYLDTDSDGINDKYYKKGIYVEASSPFDTTGIKIVKYQP